MRMNPISIPPQAHRAGEGAAFKRCHAEIRNSQLPEAGKDLFMCLSTPKHGFSLYP